MHNCYFMERPLPDPLTLSRSEQCIVDTLDDGVDARLTTLLKWSEQNSGSRNNEGLANMRGLLIEQFAELPAVMTEIDLPMDKRVNLQGQITNIALQPALEITARPDAPVQLVLTGHYDTVFPEDSHFQHPIKQGTDRINGPGMADMKGGLMVMFMALAALERSDIAKNIGYTILMSPDEEIGSPGSAVRLAELGRRSHVGLTYEPALADGSMAGARKGSGNFVLVIRGRAAHAGREHHLGRNAIAAMARFVTKLDALNGQREGVTFNIGKIDGGGATNIVPELAIGRFNTRMKHPEDTQWIKAEIDRLVSEVVAEDGITAELSGGFSRLPKPMAPANETVFNWVKQAGGLLGQTIRWTPSGGVCEGNNLWASGCPNVDTLGVRGGDIHSDREYMIVPSLIERARLSAVILMKLASGEFDAHAVKRLAAQPRAGV